VALVGVLADKDWRSMLPPLLDRVDAAVLAVPPSAPTDRRWDAQAAAEAFGGGAAPGRPGASGSEGTARVRAIPDFADALGAARQRAGSGTVVVTGSVHTVGSAMRLLGVDPLA
jgi:folylpolyglutamate synthase/dihydropteroate synthase